MGKESGAKAWAMVLMTVMVLSAFGGLSGLARGPDKAIRELEPGATTNCWAEMAAGGSVIYSNQTAIVDMPGVGTVTGTYVLTKSIPPDGVAQQIEEVVVGGPELLHGWLMEDLPADMLTRTLYVNARHNTGSEDDFMFEWSETFFGPWTQVLTVNSDVFTTYSAPLPPIMAGPFYLRVFDDTTGDAALDSIYVDMIRIESVDGPPVANAGPDQLVTQHTVVTFDGSLSTDDVGITNYWWNFTDGANQTLTGMAPPYTFDNEGIFTVTLTVMDTIGQTDNDTMLVNVTDGDPPVADAGPDQEGLPGDMFIFNGTASYDPGHLGEPIIDGIMNWTWTFDDGTGPQTHWGPNPAHQFNIPGAYIVTLTVTDNPPVPPAAAPFTDTDTMNVNVTVSEAFNLNGMDIAMNSNDWILMSYPTKVSGHPFAVIVDARDDGGGFVQWDIIRGWNGTWMTSAKFWPPSLNTFNYVDNTMGFWLHISDYGDNTFTFEGPMAAPGELAIIPMKAGWNLVGYPFPVAQEMFKTFGTMFTLDCDVETYDPFSPPYYLRPVDIMTEWHNPCNGYWVHVAIDEDLWMWCP